MEKAPMTTQPSAENIVDDDNFTEMVDIEKGNPQKETTMPIDNGSIDSDVSIGEVYCEEKTHEHFIDKLSMELDHIKNKYQEKSSKKEESEYKRSSVGSTGGYSYNSNSPLTMSACSSRQLSDNESDFGDSNTLDSKRTFFKKITYKDVEASLNKHYTREVQMSSELDILLTYLKGQRHIFNQANRITIQKFNMLMFPAIFITGSMTVLAPFLDSVGWSDWLLSILNALLTVIDRKSVV